jgi:hypothetical protein
MANVLRRNASLSGTLQSTRGRGSWDPNGRPQSTGVAGLSGFPRRCRSRSYHVTFKPCCTVDPTMARRFAGITKTNYRRNEPSQSTRISLNRLLDGIFLRDLIEATMRFDTIHPPTLFDHETSVRAQLSGQPDASSQARAAESCRKSIK